MYEVEASRLSNLQNVGAQEFANTRNIDVSIVDQYHVDVMNKTFVNNIFIYIFLKKCFSRKSVASIIIKKQRLHFQLQKITFKIGTFYRSSRPADLWLHYNFISFITCSRVQ